jgi:2-phosphoglycerate kinase
MNKKVIIIGGSPMIGKTTLAIEIASKYKYSCISTDDIGESLRAVINDKLFNPMLNTDYKDYYQNKTIDELINDCKIQHEKYHPSILAVINAHLNWGHPIVIEGWNLYPEIIKSIKSEKICSIWLIASEELLKERLNNNKNFYKDAKNPELLKTNYLNRSLWHNKIIEEQAIQNDMRIIKISKEKSFNSIFKECKKMFQ